MSRELFEQHVSWLASNYNCVSLTALLEQQASGNIAPRTVCVTFDDGFRNNCTVALPILKKYRVPATVFVAVGYVGRDQLIWADQLAGIIAVQCGKSAVRFNGESYSVRIPDECAKTYRSLASAFKKLHPYLIETELLRLVSENNVDTSALQKAPWFDEFRIADWQHLREMRSSELVEIGSHTINHTIVSRLTRDEARLEISECKKILTANIDASPYFAYPNGGDGDFSNEHRELAIGAGYRAVVTAIAGTFTKHSDPFNIYRIGVGAETSVPDLDYMLRLGAAYSNRRSITQLMNGVVSGTMGE